MITFSCSSCREKFEVDDKQAGQMGKCPNCGAMMRVPQKSANIFQIFKPNVYFEDKKLNSLYLEFLNNYEARIVQQRIEKFDDVEGVVIEIRANGRRTQIVNVFVFVLNGIRFLGTASVVGEITYNETAVAALRSVNIFSMHTISLDSDNVLKVSNMRLADNLTATEFAFAIINIAEFADAMEKDIFGSDTK
jgi:hypothetical protein